MYERPEEADLRESQRRFIRFMSRQDAKIDSQRISREADVPISTVYRLLEKYGKMMSVGGEITDSGKKRYLYAMKDRYRSAIREMKDRYGIEVTDFI